MKQMKRRRIRLCLAGFVCVTLLSLLLLFPAKGLALQPGLYVADVYQFGVYYIDLAANPLMISRFYPQTGIIESPIFLEEDGGGNLIISVREAGTILRVSPEGELIETIAAGLIRPHGVAYDNAGNLYVAEWGPDCPAGTYCGPGSIKRISPTGETLTVVTGQGPISGLKFDDRGNLYAVVYGNTYPSPDMFSGSVICMNHMDLVALMPESPPINPTVIVEDLNFPVGLTYLDRHLYISEFSSYRILTIDLDTHTLATFYPPNGELIPPPRDLEFDWQGNLYISQGDRVSIIDHVLHLTTIATGFSHATGLLYARFQAGDFCTYDQGSWGATPKGGNTGTLLRNNFTAVYPGLYVEIGISGASGNSIVLTSSNAIDAYLPQGKAPNRLTSDLANPTTTSAGQFGGQVLALQLNIDFNLADVIQGGPFGDLKLRNTGTSLDGKTLKEVVGIANIALGGGPLPRGFTYNSLNNLLIYINSAFNKCAPSAWAQDHLRWR